MNRVIKFRAKYNSSVPHTRLKQGVSWLYGDLATLAGMCRGPVRIVYRICDGDGSYDVLPDTIGQFTGLKDKNGVEIYEGDIVGCKEFFGDNTYLIGWDADWCQWALCDRDGKPSDHLLFTCLHKYEPVEPGINRRVKLIPWEVVGNIYDNPELLNNV